MIWDFPSWRFTDPPPSRQKRRFLDYCRLGFYTRADRKTLFFFLLEWVPWKTCHYAHTWTYSNNSYLGWNLVFPHRPQSSKILPKIWRFVRGGPIFPIDLNIMWVYPNFINFASNYYISNFKAIRQYLTFPHVPPFLLK